MTEQTDSPENAKPRKNSTKPSHSQFSSSESSANQFDSSINHLQDSLPNLEQIANHKYMLPTSPNGLSQLMSLPASASQIHPVLIKSETSTSQIQSAFIKTETSDSQFESSPNWVNCSQCDTLFPGPHVLKMHVALHHNKNKNGSKLSDSNPSTSNALKLKAQNSLTFQESQQNADDSSAGIDFDCTLKRLLSSSLLLCIWTSFQVPAHTKAGQNTFS